ncbi:MAG: hypothetical protein J6N72_04035 [Psychrobacter sp.]|nr:hypothetical protein [Psychrobacter sp.]
MSYKELLLDDDTVLILPLYDKGYSYSDVNTEIFYQKTYIKFLLEKIEGKLLDCLNGYNGEKKITLQHGIRSIKTSFIPKKEDAINTTLIKVKILLKTNTINDVEITVKSILFKNKDLTTSIKAYIGESLLNIKPASALLTLSEKDKHYMSQFGRLSEMMITSKDVFWALQKALIAETNEVHIILASEITDIVNLVDLAVFEAFGRIKATPAIIKTSLPL